MIRQVLCRIILRNVDNEQKLYTHDFRCEEKQEFAKVIKGRFKQESRGANLVTAISKCRNKIYFVPAWSEGIPFCIKASKHLFPLDGCFKSVVLAAFDEDV